MSTTKRNIEVSVVVPTYNERENVGLLCDGIREALGDTWDYEVIFVDDNSPDGTAGVVRQLAKQDPAIKLLERPGKMGLGSAVVDGFRMAQGDYWVMMDGDLSHRPEDLPRLLKTLSEADIVVGSRYVPGGRVVNWPLHRRLISRGASAVGRFLVGLSVRDCTSGMGAFRRQAVEPVLSSLKPKGFKLLFEVLARAGQPHVTEVPILFVERRYGQSKFSLAEAVQYLRLCFELRRARA